VEKEANVSREHLGPGTFLFQWGRLLGAGGLGRVDEVTVTWSNRSYAPGTRLACKRLNQKWKAHPEMQKRFEREIAAVKAMKHPGIVAYRGENVSEGDERFYLMPLYPTSVRHELAKHPSGFQLLNVARFGLELVSALEYAHVRGFIHRDLKPENVLLDEQKRAVIADWGLGYFIHKESVVLDHLTRGGMGTAYYCCLEQWTTGKCEVNGDIYSLGLMLAELLTGRQVPIQLCCGITQDVLAGSLPASTYMNRVLKWMTHCRKENRAQYVGDVRMALGRVIEFCSQAA
jgi:serine/threonine protein kinase